MNPQELMTDREPTQAARTLTAEVLDSVAMRADGTAFDESNLEHWNDPEEAPVELVALGAVRLRLLDRDATAIATAAGAITEDGPAVVCFLAELDLDSDSATPRSGQYFVVDAEGVPLVLRVWLTGDDVRATPPAEWGYPVDAEVNPDLAELLPGQVLLVQAHGYYEGSVQP